MPDTHPSPAPQGSHASPGPHAPHAPARNEGHGLPALSPRDQDTLTALLLNDFDPLTTAGAAQSTPLDVVAFSAQEHIAPYIRAHKELTYARMEARALETLARLLNPPHHASRQLDHHNTESRRAATTILRAVANARASMLLHDRAHREPGKRHESAQPAATVNQTSAPTDPASTTTPTPPAAPNNPHAEPPCNSTTRQLQATSRTPQHANLSSTRRRRMPHDFLRALRGPCGPIPTSNTRNSLHQSPLFVFRFSPFTPASTGALRDISSSRGQWVRAFPALVLHPQARGADMNRRSMAFAAAAGVVFSLSAFAQVKSNAAAADGAVPSAAPAGAPALGGTTSLADAGLCQLVNVRSWGRVGDIHAFSIRTDTWNIGGEPLPWQEFTPVHPLMAQNIYRYKDGRLEQIGLSWIKHAFCALQQSGCGNCTVQPGCLDFLGPGCRDPYSANLNGNQVRLGPRSEVNPSNTQFPYPFTLGWQQTGDNIYKRIQIRDADLNPAMNMGARYFLEGQIMHVQEGATSLRYNNATHEESTVSPSGDTYEFGPGFNTVQMKPAIYAWQEVDPGVVVQAVDVTGEDRAPDGRFHLAYRVYDNGDGTWRYEYALHNLNSHRAARGFEVPRHRASSVVETFYHDVKYHSGEVYTSEDWETTIGHQDVSWTGQKFDQNPNANALRWGTMFNFSVTTDAAPQMGTVRINLFRPGGRPFADVPALVPTGAISACAADLNGDGEVDLEDLQIITSSMGPCPKEGACPADLNGDGRVNGRDMQMLTHSLGPCP